MKRAAFVAITAALAVLLSWDPARAVYLDSTGRPVASFHRPPFVALIKIPVVPTEHGTAGAAGLPDWDAIAFCESHGNWATNTGNGYWGGLQFAPSTWFAYGGGPFDGTGPFPYSREDQIAVAERVYVAQGPGAWPNCFRWSS